ncbi:MAG: DUF3524 domain-containing protein [Thermoanaerobaculia bacterium]|nr:DUF3524 domain-containing protein [Thermoanaerobaculia bacterium]
MLASNPTTRPAEDSLRPRWLLLEPYYGGSHRYLTDALIERLPVDFELLSMPPRKWKWRMRGAALHFARQLQAREEELQDKGPFAGLFVTSLMDVAALRGLLPASLRGVPVVVYCHENQLRYPVQVEDKRDYHYAWTNLQSLMAADRIRWNSAYNRDSFLEELPKFLRRLPDARPRGLVGSIKERSKVLPVPLDLGSAHEAKTRAERRRGQQRRGPCRLVWNHRWEHDKGPRVFFKALRQLVDQEVDFEVAVLGQAFQRQPIVFDQARDWLGSRVVRWGFVESREEYLDVLAESDFVVSTALHEFQGLAVLEAAACGAIPLVPDALAYPEIWPEELLYERGGLATALRQRISHLDSWRQRTYSSVAEAFDWDAQLLAWHDLFYAKS